MKKFLLPILSLILVVIGFSFYAYKTLQAQDPTNNWKTYTDSVNVYSFRYPEASYQTIIPFGNGIQMYPYKVKSPIYLNTNKDVWIQTSRIANAPLEEYIAFMKKSVPYESYSLSQTTFNTIPGYEINSVRTTGQGREYAYSFNTHVHNDTYVFTLLAANKDPLEKKKEEFRKILSTLVIK